MLVRLFTATSVPAQEGQDFTCEQGSLRMALSAQEVAKTGEEGRAEPRSDRNRAGTGA
jgi:hypothetical protein